MALEFAERIRRIPVYPAADGYALRGDVALLASNESPYPPLPEVVEAVDARAARRSTATRTRRTPRCGARSSDRYGVPAARIAIGNGSCDILLAAGEALLEPGAEVVYAWPSFSVYPHLAAASGARGDRGAARRRRPPRPRGDGRPRSPAATRLVIVCNPNNPTSTALPLARIAGFVDGVPRHVCGDPRRGLLRVQHAARTRTSRSTCSSATRTSCCCGRSRRSTGSAGCASATRCAARRTSVTRSTRSASRSSATPPRRPRRSRRCATRTRSTRRVERNGRPSAWGSRTGCAGSGIEPAESQANFVWFDLPRAEDRPEERERRSPRPAPTAACSCAPAPRWAARARCA